MNKEPVGLYIFRYVMGMAMLAFMAMLYWSSVLVEEGILDVRNEVREVQEALSDLRSDMSRYRTETLNRSALRKEYSLKSEQTTPLGQETQRERGSNRPHIDPNLPNLLTEDPFYMTALPELLPANFRPHGIRRGATVGRPENLHPFSNWSNVSSWSSQCTVRVAQMHFGKYETMAPDMAIKLELRQDKQGRPEYWVHLRDNVFWQPLNAEWFPDEIQLDAHFLKRHQVTAEDFKFYYDAVMNTWVQEAGAVSLRNYLGDIEEFRVIDPLTFVVRWAAKAFPQEDGTTEFRNKYIAKGWTGNLQPLARWVYQYFPDGSKIIREDSDPDTYQTDSVWAQNFNEHWARNVIVSCGAWTFDGISERQISFRRNMDYYEPLAVLVEGMEVQFKDTPDAIWQDFKAGNIDTYEISPDKLAELEEFLASETYLKRKEKQTPIHRLNFLSRSYTYIGWNLATPYFAERTVRQAMTMAIDRERIIEQNLNSMGIPITGPFFRYSKAYDASIQPWPFDPQQARRQLNQAGWYDSDGDGLLDREWGEERLPFRFSLTYYVKSPTAKAIAEYVTLALKEVDIDCELNGVDITDLSERFEDKSFDALYLGWAQGSPPPEPRQLWHSSGAKEKGSSNAIGFTNKEIDSIIDELAYEYDPARRQELYHRFDRIIHEEAPYTFLYTPKSAFLYRDYVQNVFIPAERQDLIPGADVGQPQPSIFWLKTH